MRPDPKSALTLSAPYEAHPDPNPSATEVSAPRFVETDTLLGTVIDGRYHVERLIGEGGMGMVYLGRHRVIDKRVAIKVLRREMARDQEMTERFLLEARTASSVGNAHIVDVSDFGILPEGWTYFVMEYLDGRSLTSALEELKCLALPRVVHIAKQVARGLGAAHAAGIVHRDLKPDNVMLVTRGQDHDFVKILDFGIAKVGSQATKITRAGSIFGTPHYMAPEQAAGTPADSRTDVYALGVMMYEMIAGRVPFDAEAVMGVLSQHLYKHPQPLAIASGRADVSASLEAIVMKCLQKQPDHRYPSMDALMDDLEALERGLLPMAAIDSGRGSSPNPFEPPTATSGVALANTQPHLGRRLSRNVAVAGVAGILVLGVVGVVALRGDKERTPAIVSPATAQPVEVANAPPGPTPAPPAPVEKLLLVTVDPLDAKVMRDGVDLGTSPIPIRLTEGQRATVIVSRAGYAPRTEVFDAADLDSNETRRVVRLTPQNGRAARPPVKTGAPRPAVRPKISEHDDPWKKTP